MKSNRLFRILSLAAYVVADGCRLDAQVSESPPPIDLCGVWGKPGARQVAVRGLARIVDGGWLLVDGTCPLEYERNVSLPLLLKALDPTYRRAADRRMYQRFSDSFERPLFQIVIRGRVECRDPKPSYDSGGYMWGAAYGSSGLVACVLNEGSVEGVWLLRGN